MFNELYVAFSLLWAGSLVFILMMVSLFFFNYWLKYHPRLEKRIIKTFAFFPTKLSTGKSIWGKFYYKYQVYEAGYVLGGTIKEQKFGKKISWMGSGSFIPSYSTKYLGESWMSCRKYKKQSGWMGVLAKKKKTQENLKNLEKFFGKELMDKWVKNTQ